MDNQFIGFMDASIQTDPEKVLLLNPPSCTLRLPFGTVASLPEELQKDFTHIKYQYDFGGLVVDFTPEEEQHLDLILGRSHA